MMLDRITSNPARMNGQPCVRDMRLTVRRVVELVALYPNREELHREYPELEEEDISQALVFAAAALDDRILDLGGSHERVWTSSRKDAMPASDAHADDEVAAIAEALADMAAGDLGIPFEEFDRNFRKRYNLPSQS